MQRNFVTWNSIQCQYGSGSWAVIDGILTVRTATGSKAAPLDGASPELLATILMGEIARDHQSITA
jgi:hypothetical protein